MGRFLRIKPEAFFLGAMCLYLLPFQWVIGASAAAVVHEIAHLAALRITGASICSVTVGALGAKIETGPLEAGQEVLCSLAGPLGSFSMLLFCRVFPEAALWGLAQGLFNLIPVYPMDGGRAIRCFLPDTITRWVEKISLSLLLVTGIWMRWLWFSVFILALGCMERKYPCKATEKAVQ